jgi:flavin-binding protein dodecin
VGVVLPRVLVQGALTAIRLTLGTDRERSTTMAESVYRVTELVGVSTESWEDAARNAIETAAKSLRDLRVAEVDRLDITIEDGKVASYRARLNVSFKYESGD